jgi:uncharacterized protein YbjT (DUF2867 family)
MTDHSRPEPGLTLLTGATGYVGGRLLPELERRGYRVRCLTRRPDALLPRVAATTEVVCGDLSIPATLATAFDGIDTAFYLVHALGTKHDFEAEERAGAEAFAREARAAGVKRIIYLGGLGPEEIRSPHLRSRHAVGRILRESGIPTFELRASIIIGSGSLSFEMVRALVEKLPVMVTPRWVQRLAQPIGIEDVIAYLLEAAELPASKAGTYEIGGPDQLAYRDLLVTYARLRGLRRLIFRVPVLTPRLSSLWLGLVTPVYARIGRKLVDSIQHDTVVTDQRAREVFSVVPRGVEEAIRRALANEDREFAATRWSDAVSSVGVRSQWGGQPFARRVVDARYRVVDVGPARAFNAIERIGGSTGWYYADWLWRLRGWLDLLVGGAGLRRGRRNPEHLLPGDTVDWWRVEAVEPGRLLRLRAEMRLPGRAWLQFEVESALEGARIWQTAIFDPIGLAGRLYWYVLYPVHSLIFAGMLRALARSAAAPDRRGAGAAVRAWR